MKISSQDLLVFAQSILEKAGLSLDEAGIVAQELVNADLMGVSSHGVMRIPQYLNQIKDGLIIPGAQIEVVKESPTTVILDSHQAFGQLLGNRMSDILAEKAHKSGIACGISLNTPHVGRVGSYTEKLAKQGLIAFCTVGLYSSGPMAPWGGREGRLGTNPLSYAVPRLNGRPVMMDGATTVVAEGKLRSFIQKGKSVPLGWIKDGQGQDTTDPRDFYKVPHGTILPLGGNSGGAKGSGLAVMADLFSIALANEDYWTDPENGKKLTAENGVFMLAIDPDRFFGLEALRQQVENHCAFIKSSQPADGFDAVLTPGEFEYQTAERQNQEGIDLTEDTWQGLIILGKEMGCSWAQKLESQSELKNFVYY